MRRRDRQHPLLGETVEIGERRAVGDGVGQHRAADQHQRPLGRIQHRGQPVEIFARAVPPPRAGAAGRARHRSSSSKISSGRITATGPCVPLSATWKARAIASDACSGSLTSITSLVTSDKQARIILLLQRQAAEILALDLADQQHQRRRVVIGRMQRDHGVRQPRPARDDAASRRGGAAGRRPPP